jgi:hypothetical protein
MRTLTQNETARARGAESVPGVPDVQLEASAEAEVARARTERSIGDRLALFAQRLALGAALVGLWQLVVEAEIWDRRRSLRNRSSGGAPGSERGIDDRLDGGPGLDGVQSFRRALDGEAMGDQLG